MGEFIERESLYEKAYWHGEHPNLDNPFPDGVDAIDIKDVDAIPAADVAQVVHGRWKYEGPTINTYGMMKCTACNWWTIDPSVSTVYHYCPNCGAKMDGGAD